MIAKSAATGKSWVRRFVRAKDQELVKIFPVLTVKSRCVPVCFVINTQSNLEKTGFVASYSLQSGHEGKLGQEPGGRN